jgi:hypothetical protein
LLRQTGLENRSFSLAVSQLNIGGRPGLLGLLLVKFLMHVMQFKCIFLTNNSLATNV